MAIFFVVVLFDSVFFSVLLKLIPLNHVWTGLTVSESLLTFSVVWFLVFNSIQLCLNLLEYIQLCLTLFNSRSYAQILCLFVKQFVLESLKSFSVLKLSTFYMLQNMNFNITYLPKPYQKNFPFWFIRNWFCIFKLFLSKCPNYGRGRGGPSQVWASKLFASIPA